MVSTEFGAKAAADEGREHAALRLLRLHRLKLSQASPGIKPQHPGRVVHGPVAGVSATSSQFLSESTCGKLLRTASSVSGTRT